MIFYYIALYCIVLRYIILYAMIRYYNINIPAQAAQAVNLLNKTAFDDLFILYYTILYSISSYIIYTILLYHIILHYTLSILYDIISYYSVS